MSATEPSKTDAAIDAALQAGESVANEAAGERLQAELAECKDRLLRAQAEFDNYRKRARRELEDELKYAQLPLLRDLLPVIDNIGRAIDAGAKAAEVGALLEGFKMVGQMLEAVLERHHCVKMRPLHQPFDPHLHEAIQQQPTSDVEPGTVTLVAVAGYQLHDRVVRPAQVIVAKAAEE